MDGQTNRVQGRTGNGHLIEALESRRLLSWGAFASLIDQDLAGAKFPTLDGRGVVIADLDTGINFKHPALAGRIWTNPGEIPGNKKDDDGNGYVDDVHGWDFAANDNDPSDDQGHGTMTAGLLVANHFFNFGNKKGYAGDKHDYQGIAKGATVLPLKVIDASLRMVPSRVEAALKWLVTNHRRYHIVAVNISLSVGRSGYSLIADEMQQLWNDGVFIAAASGNGQNKDNELMWPAASPYAMSVGALNVTDTLNPITSRGPALDILAPGNEVPYLSLSGDYWLSGAATSPATPWVAAAGALLKQINPSFSAAEVRSILMESGKPVFDRSTGLTFKRLDLDDALALGIKRAGTAGTPFSNKPINVSGNPGPSGGNDNGGVLDLPPGAIQAESANAIRGLVKTWNSLAYADDGDWARYNRVNFGLAGKAKSFTARVAVADGYEGGQIQIRLDGPNGMIVGRLTLARTGGWAIYRNRSIALPPSLSGTHDLYLRFTGGKSIANVDWIKVS